VLTQFRQIGVPDARTTNAEVRQQLRRAQQRTESVLNRPQLPRPSVLLNVLKALRRAVQTAYSLLPLQRLKQLEQQLDTLQDDVDRGAYFGFCPTTLGTHQTLRQFYSDLTGLLVDLTEPWRPRKQETDSVLQSFMEKAAQRGWKVPATQHTATENQDGFVQSIDYVRKISIPPQQLLPSHTDFGVTTGSIVLMTEQSIPESTLNNWAQQQQDVYIVFGHYVVLPNVRLLGVLPHLATTGGSNGNATVDIERFVSISELLQDREGPILNDLIRYPRRICHHYYCPLVGVAGQDRRYFQTWDLLTQQRRST